MQVVNGGGLQPWIQAVNVDPTNLTILAIAPSCREDQHCEGTAVDFEVVGTYVRPRAALPAGTRLRVTHGRERYTDFTVQAAAGKAAFKPLKRDSVAFEPDLQRTTLELSAGTEDDTLAGTMVLVYYQRPDPAHPLEHVAEIRGQSLFESQLSISTQERGSFGIPLQVWVVMSDQDGHFSSPQKVL